MEIHATRSTLPRLLALVATAALAACGASPDASPTMLRAPIGTSPVSGPADAWVTVVAFSDFECPYCARAQETLTTVLPGYGADVRYVFKHFPLAVHPHARPTAIAAACAQAQGKFWAFHDLVFSTQSALMTAANFEAALASTAGSAGLDVPTWQACRSGAAASATVADDLALGNALGVHGTPTFAVNGVPVVGAVPAATFRAVIDQALATARASGIPAAQYYDRAVLGL